MRRSRKRKRKGFQADKEDREKREQRKCWHESYGTWAVSVRTVYLREGTHPLSTSSCTSIAGRGQRLNQKDGMVFKYMVQQHCVHSQCRITSSLSISNIFHQLYPLNINSPFLPPPQHLVTSILPFVSINFLISGTSYNFDFVQQLPYCV